MAYKKKQRDTFIRVFEATGTVATAAKAAGMTTSGAYRHREANESFKRRWDEAKNASLIERIEEAEDAAFQRGVRGYKEPIVHLGKVVGHKVKFSDRCLQLWLMAKKPDQWSEQHRTEVGATVTVRTEVVEMPPLDPVLEAKPAEATLIE